MAFLHGICSVTRGQSGVSLGSFVRRAVVCAAISTFVVACLLFSLSNSSWQGTKDTTEVDDGWWKRERRRWRNSTENTPPPSSYQFGANLHFYFSLFLFLCNSDHIHLFRGCCVSSDMVWWLWTSTKFINIFPFPSLDPYVNRRRQALWKVISIIRSRYLYMQERDVLGR